MQNKSTAAPTYIKLKYTTLHTTEKRKAWITSWSSSCTKLPMTMMVESPSMPLNHSDSTPLRAQNSDPTTDVLEISVSGWATRSPTELLMNQDGTECDVVSQRLALMLIMSPFPKLMSALKIKFTGRSVSILQKWTYQRLIPRWTLLSVPGDMWCGRHVPVFQRNPLTKLHDITSQKTITLTLELPG